jgi:hypothetical protein
MPDLFTNEVTTNQPEATSPLISESHLHALSSFCQHPGSMTFATQEKDEVILLFLRKHFITNVPWIITTLFFIIAPILTNILITASGFSLSFLPPTFLSIFLAFYYLIVFAYVFVSFITWFYNVSFITTNRVVDIDFSDIVFKNIAATKLIQVEDVSFSQVGVIRSLFDYGDVLIQTAATVDNFDLLAVPHPEKVVQIVEELIGRSK